MKPIQIVLVVVMMVVLNCDSLVARGPGGGGGGRGGGGGGARPAAPAAGRSPSMSPGAGARPPQASSRPAAGGGTAARPATGAGNAARPNPGAGTAKAAAGAGAARTGAAGTARTGAGAGVGSRPTSSQLNNFLDVPKASTGAVAGGGRGGAAADFLQQGGSTARPSQLSRGAAAAAGAAGIGAAGRAVAGERAVGAATGERRQNLAENRPGRIENRQQWQQNRGDRVQELHDQMHNDTPLRDFWSENPVWGAWAITRPFRWANWGAVGGWMGYGTTDPGYYNYGENVYYQDGAVYSGDQQVATADEYAQQAETLATSAPETAPKDMQWMPLGVFALTQDGEASGAPPTLFMQLVLSKEGVISGTFTNKSSGVSQTLEGMVDKKSQRAAWGVEGQQRPIIETGLANLTKDSSPALIHFDSGETQQWLLVRLEEPKGSQ